VHFGIPATSTLHSVTIVWPSGRRQTFEGEAARMLLGQETAVEEPIEEIARVDGTP
jgi:hypothetical protein